MLKNYIFSSESVSEGHPDKVADQISDAVLDAMLAQDPKSRVACETMVTTGVAIVAGEVTTKANVNIPDVVRKTVLDIGYDDGAKGFDGNTCSVQVALDRQSPDISQGVTEGEGLFAEQGAGDQGLMFGFACDETPELMPLPIMLAHHLVRKCSEVRKAGKLTFLRPDSKSQVSVVYENGKPVRLHNIVISTQHNPEVEYKVLRDAIIEEVMLQVVPSHMMPKDESQIFVNPTGRFVLGGPHGDCGLTGRKIIVDTYGGMGRHGGGAFSGKDPSKVDRSAAYMARYVAKNIVAAGLATRCEVQLAYAIGVAEPLSVLVDDFGTSKLGTDKLSQLVRKHFELKPAGIIRTLDLLKPRYSPSAAYGHFGRTEDSFTWERTDKAEALKADAR